MLAIFAGKKTGKNSKKTKKIFYRYNNITTNTTLED